LGSNVIFGSSVFFVWTTVMLFLAQMVCHLKSKTRKAALNSLT